MGINHCTNLNKVEATQRKAIKFAFCVPKDAPINIFSEAKVFPLLPNNKVLTCLFMFKYSKYKTTKMIAEYGYMQ